ncbi:uncharacterized protein LOC129590704 [Paramacrobiotus metropolitanus]|uniref:uncharacterized protein LOC129590704 n=1 Tax=Paramacrobiotus metropolitanus TaxID=2943436 RepID=UPI002445C882|nr:uncharacterized protein LOC129590704 [Paramacrobiotus metropolitanus]
MFGHRILLCLGFVVISGAREVSSLRPDAEVESITKFALTHGPNLICKMMVSNGKRIPVQSYRTENLPDGVMYTIIVSLNNKPAQRGSIGGFGKILKVLKGKDGKLSIEQDPCRYNAP